MKNTMVVLPNSVKALPALITPVAASAARDGCAEDDQQDLLRDPAGPW